MGFRSGELCPHEWINAAVKELVEWVCCLLPIYILPYKDAAKRPTLDAGALILDFTASRTVRDKLLFSLNYPVSDIFVITAENRIRLQPSLKVPKLQSISDLSVFSLLSSP
jgi:hypothetical protein